MDSADRERLTECVSVLETSSDRDALEHAASALAAGRAELLRCPGSAWLTGSPPWGQAPPPGVRPHLAEPDPPWRLERPNDTRRVPFGRSHADARE